MEGNDPACCWHLWFPSSSEVKGLLRAALFSLFAPVKSIWRNVLFRVCHVVSCQTDAHRNTFLVIVCSVVSLSLDISQLSAEIPWSSCLKARNISFNECGSESSVTLTSCLEGQPVFTLPLGRIRTHTHTHIAVYILNRNGRLTFESKSIVFRCHPP